MIWHKYTIQTTTAAEDFISAMLDELGIEGIEIENNVPLTKADQADMFIDFAPQLPPDEGISYVSFYLEEGVDHSRLLKKVTEGIKEQRMFVDVGEGSITEGVTEDLDWINNWKEFFHAFSIGDILIKPTWEDLQESDRGKCCIEIDPGVSFGTGKHETTQLCIRQLQKYIKNGQEQRVLDVGFGSGILSVVALKLGAASVDGTDLDENCMASARDNMAINHLSEDLARFYIGNLIDDVSLQEKVGTECFDIAVANILAEVIVPMVPVVFARLKHGGIFITSGIIDTKENVVKDAIEASGMKILEVDHQGEWVSVTAQKE